MGVAKAEFFVDEAGEHRWRLKGANGEVICTSEGYTREADAIRAFLAMPTWTKEAVEHWRSLV